MAGIASASEQAPNAALEVSIPFIGHGTIKDWQPDKRQGLWIQDEHHRWYYARLKEPCWGLDNAETIALDTRPGGPFDRFSSIIVPHEERCHLQSLVRSDPPPKKVKRAVTKDKS
jgi:Family of unknown function (DUF6491)